MPTPYCVWNIYPTFTLLLKAEIDRRIIFVFILGLQPHHHPHHSCRCFILPAEHGLLIVELAHVIGVDATELLRILHFHLFGLL